MIQGFIFSLITATASGTLLILAKLGYQSGMSSMLMMQCRFSFAIAILFAYLALFRRNDLRISLRRLAQYAFMGSVIYFAQSYFFVAAAEHIPAATESLIVYFYPVTVTVLSALFYNMKVDRVVVGSLGLVFFGCALVFYDAFLQQMNMKGILLTCGAMLTFSTYLVLIQKLLKGESPYRATFYILLFACISFNIFGDVSEYRTMTSQQMLIGLWMGVFPTAIAVIALYLAIERIGSAWTSIFSSIEPVVTLVAASWFLGEKIVAYQAAGAALIIAGIVLPHLIAVRKKRLLLTAYEKKVSGNLAVSPKK